MSGKREGDHCILDGSETWTTYAQWADWIFCLVRTSKEDKKQNGISFILVDMKSPGITISPINTLDDTPVGEQEINSVFFDNVKVPVEDLHRLGRRGLDLRQIPALTLRTRLGLCPGQPNALRKAREIARMETARGRPLLEDPDFARKLADLEIQIEALDATERRIFDKLSSGQSVGRCRP